MVNINDPFQQHQCCKEQDNIGVYFQAMGAQQFSCSFILRLGTLGNQNQSIGNNKHTKHHAPDQQKSGETIVNQNKWFTRQNKDLP